MKLSRNNTKYFKFWFRNFIKEKSVYFLIGIIVCFYLINNFIWLTQNTYPSGPDEPAHLTISLRFFRYISSNIKDIFQSFTSIESHWPPLFHISSAVLNLFLGTSYLSSVMINILYLIILLFSVYFIGLKLFDKITGISAIIFISMYPMIFRYSRFFGPDFALTAMVCLSICFLLYTEHFKDKKFSILFGFSLGLGMLIKRNFILFLVGPITYTLLRIFFLKIKQAPYLRQRFLNFSSSLVIGILISLFWYWPAFSIVIGRIELFFWTIIHDPSVIDPEFTYYPIFKLEKFFDYLRLLINEQISLLFFIVFLAAVFFYFLRCKNKLLLILWYMVPYFILSLSFYKEGLFMLPSLPALALISAAGFQSILSKKWKYFLYYTVILLGFVQFFDISYNPYRKGQTFPIQTPIGDIHTFYSPNTEHHSWSYGPPLKKNWKMENIVNSIARQYNQFTTIDIHFPVIGVICEDNYAREIFGCPFIIDYYLLKENKDVHFSVFNLLRSRSTLNFVIELDNLDCIIFISKSNSWPKFDDFKKDFNRCLFHWEKWQYCQQGLLFMHAPPINNTDTFFKERANRRLEEFLDDKDSRFKLIEEMKLPDGYSAYIYGKENYNLLMKDLLILTFFKGGINLWYDDKKLTANGIKTSFRYKDKEYNSSTATWQVKKLANGRLEARGKWRDLPDLTQIWQFELVNDEEVICEVGLESDKSVDIKDLGMAKIELSLNNNYMHWLSIYKEGKFRNVKNGGVILKDATTKFIGVLNKLEDKSIIPAVFFILEEPTYSLAQVHYSNNKRRLIYWTNLNKNLLYFKEQRCVLFKTYIKMIQSSKELKELIKEQRKKEMQRRNKLKSNYSLNKDSIKIFLDFGQGRIYWKDQEITEGFGFYTSLLANGYWHDSQNVLWEIDKIDESTLLAQGRWIDLPLSQIWEVKLIKDNLIEWNIELEVYEKIKLEEVQANIILSEDYRIAGFNILEAIPQFNSSLGHIKFMLKDNSSICHKKRVAKADFLNSKAIVLTYYNILNSYQEPGRYKYFIGEIGIK